MALPLLDVPVLELFWEAPELPLPIPASEGPLPVALSLPDLLRPELLPEGELELPMPLPEPATSTPRALAVLSSRRPVTDRLLDF